MGKRSATFINTGLTPERLLGLVNRGQEPDADIKAQQDKFLRESRDPKCWPEHVRKLMEKK
jgi:hypothetical protein